MSSPTQAHQHQATSQATGTAHQQPSEQPQPQQQQLTSPTTNPNNNNTMESSILTAMQTRIINLEKTCYSLHKENTELADKVDELEECLMLEQDQVTTDKIRSTNRRINDHDRDLAMVRDRVRALELSLTQAIKGRNAQGQPVNGGGGLIPPNRNSKKRKTRPTPEILSIIPRPPSPEVELPVVMGENLKGVGQGAGRGVGGGGFGGGALTTGGAGGVELERVESMVCEVSKLVQELARLKLQANNNGAPATANGHSDVNGHDGTMELDEKEMSMHDFMNFCATTAGHDGVKPEFLEESGEI